MHTHSSSRHCLSAHMYQALFQAGSMDPHSPLEADFSLKCIFQIWSDHYKVTCPRAQFVEILGLECRHLSPKASSGLEI